MHTPCAMCVRTLGYKQSSYLSWLENKLPLRMFFRMQSERVRRQQNKSMHQVAALLRRWPRMSTALTFGAAGTALSLLFWSPLIFQARGVLAFVLFIGTPGVSAGIAGWTLGKWLLDSARVRPGSAALCGAIISSLALLLFAPLFATVYILTQPAAEHWDIVSLTFLLLVGSAFVMWFRLAVIGAAVGWVLYRLAAHDTGRASA